MLDPNFTDHFPQGICVPYYPLWRTFTGSIEATLLLRQILYLWINNGQKPFYKFKEPAEGHPFYRDGDSWLEELAFSRREFDRARQSIATMTEQEEIDPRALVSYWRGKYNTTWYAINERVLIEELAKRAQYEKDLSPSTTSTLAPSPLCAQSATSTTQALSAKLDIPLHHPTAQRNPRNLQNQSSESLSIEAQLSNSSSSHSIPDSSNQSTSSTSVLPPTPEVNTPTVQIAQSPSTKPYVPYKAKSVSEIKSTPTSKISVTASSNWASQPSKPPPLPHQATDANDAAAIALTHQLLAQFGVRGRPLRELSKQVAPPITLACIWSVAHEGLKENIRCGYVVNRLREYSHQEYEPERFYQDLATAWLDAEETERVELLEWMVRYQPVIDGHSFGEYVPENLFPHLTAYALDTLFELYQNGSRVLMSRDKAIETGVFVGKIEG